MSSHMQCREAYIANIRHRAQHGGVDGPKYDALAEFLSHANSSESNRQAWFEPKHDHRFAWYRSLALDGKFQRIASPDDIQELASKDLSAKTREGAHHGGMILLRGYPQPDWIASIGCLYKIDPAYWICHLDFLNQPIIRDLNQHLILPSSLRNIFRFHFSCIGQGQGNAELRGRSRTRLQRLRTDAKRRMRDYTQKLRHWRTYRLGSSIVRNFSAHDDEHYSVEHAVTVGFHPIEQSSGWLILVFIDYGDQLSHSYPGPWLSHGSTKDEFVPMFDAIPLNEYSNGEGSSAEAEMPQNLSALHKGYGRTLNPEIMGGDPFYALHEIFRHAAVKEAQMLNLFAHQLKSFSSVDIDDTVVELDYAMSPSNLLYCQDHLERQIQNLQTIINVVKRRGDSSWPKMTEKSSQTAADEAACSLERDFEALLKQSRHLLKKSERLMTTVMSIASISEAKRAVRQGAMLFRFTVVASFYIPLSFTTSFFGMNVRQLGQGNQSIWVFFVVTIPVLLLSFLFIIVDRLMFLKCLKCITRFATRIFRSDR